MFTVNKFSNLKNCFKIQIRKKSSPTHKQQQKNIYIFIYINSTSSNEFLYIFSIPEAGKDMPIIL